MPKTLLLNTVLLLANGINRHRVLRILGCQTLHRQQSRAIEKDRLTKENLASWAIALKEDVRIQLFGFLDLVYVAQAQTTYSFVKTAVTSVEAY